MALVQGSPVWTFSIFCPGCQGVILGFACVNCCHVVCSRQTSCCLRTSRACWTTSLAICLPSDRFCSTLLLSLWLLNSLWWVYEPDVLFTAWRKCAATCRHGIHSEAKILESAIVCRSHCLSERDFGCFTAIPLWILFERVCRWLVLLQTCA